MRSRNFVTRCVNAASFRHAALSLTARYIGAMPTAKAVRATPATCCTSMALRRVVFKTGATAPAGLIVAPVLKTTRRKAVRRQIEAADRALEIWSRSDPVTEHPYLTRKGIAAHGVKSSRGDLVAPMRDASGSLRSLQFIRPDGSKKYLMGGQVTGCYFAIGKPDEKILIGEGYSTCASAHEATGHAVAVAFDAGNLMPVAKALRAKYPSAKIVLLADDDHRRLGNPGMTKARQAAMAVDGAVAVPEFGDSRPDDATDFNDLAQLAGADAVRRCIEKALATEPTQPSRKLLALNVVEFLSREIPPREMLLAPILPTQGLVMLYSWRGVGKTHTAIGIAYAVASGGVFLRWKAPAARRVLYLDGEMPAGVMQERIAAAAEASPTEPPTPDHLRIITPDLQPEGMPNLASVDGREAVEQWIADGCDLLVIDNISTLCRLGRENESESWEPMQTWLLDLRRRGISVALVHHSGKGGAQRGTSRREDILDTVLTLKRPDDYEPTEGARFEVHFEKCRGIVGEAAAPFEARLETRSGGTVWTMRDIEDVKLARAQILFAEGSSVRDVAEELGISKSAAGRLKKKIEAGQ